MADITAYLRRIVPSLILMGMITYGMKEQNPWLQYGSIFFILIGQMLWQSFKTIRARPMIEANVEEARRMMRRKLILEVDKGETSRARQTGKSVGGFSPKMSIILIVPLVIFLLTGYLLNNIIFPGQLEDWQSYAIGFIITMPISTILSFRMGLGSPTLTANPNSYYIGEKGIVFEHMGQYYVMRYPLVDVVVNEESNCLEIEGQPSNAPMIPTKVRLYNLSLNKLHRLLSRFMEKSKLS